MANHRETLLVIDFGGQYNQLIARRVREAGVYSEIIAAAKTLQAIEEKTPVGLIFTGGPNSVNQAGAPMVDPAVFDLGIPILGICYGAQMTAKLLGGQVESPEKREYGHTDIEYTESPLFAGMQPKNVAWMSHTDQITSLPEGFTAIASTAQCPIGAFQDAKRQIYGVQFHPEVEHSRQGDVLLRNFIRQICKTSGDFTSDSFIQEQVERIRHIAGDKKVICALSGGVDSSVAAVLVHKAIGDQLTCIFVDHGLLRKDEGQDVERVFKDAYNINLIKVDAQERFLSKLKGVTDPEQKRKIIGNEFIRVFEEESHKLQDTDFLVQGTIYPDVIESGTEQAAVIKSHHNVGGLPKDMKLSLIEPLRDLFKDEVRQVGLALGIPAHLIWRHPFPGPGLGIRVLGEVTQEKCDILREADAIYREELENAGLTRKIWQAFATLPDVKTVGVMGDERTYAYLVGLRAVTSTDGMTGEVYPLPYEVLGRISRRIVNEVRGVNRVVYDVTGKPPATIEWE